MAGSPEPSRRSTSPGRHAHPGLPCAPPKSPTPRLLRALRIPWDESETCEVLHLRITAVELSGAIGGGLLDDTCYGCVEYQGYCAYLDLERHARDLPVNRRAATLLARLGWPDAPDSPLTDLLRGVALVVGVDRTGDDVDLPDLVLVEARALRLLTPSEQP